MSSYLGDSLDHILNMTADSSNGSDFLFASEPFLHLDGLWVGDIDIDGQVTERAAKYPSWSSNHNSSTFGRYFDPFRHLYGLIYYNLLHF